MTQTLVDTLLPRLIPLLLRSLTCCRQFKLAKMSRAKEAADLRTLVQCVECLKWRDVDTGEDYSGDRSFKCADQNGGTCRREEEVWDSELCWDEENGVQQAGTLAAGDKDWHDEGDKNVNEGGAKSKRAAAPGGGGGHGHGPKKRSKTMTFDGTPRSAMQVAGASSVASKNEACCPLLHQTVAKIREMKAALLNAGVLGPKATRADLLDFAFGPAFSHELCARRRGTQPAPSTRRCCAAQCVRLRGLSPRPIPAGVGNLSRHT